MPKTSTRRKLAIATWSAPREGNIYGKLVINADEALRFIDHMRDTTGAKITMTHLVGKAAGLVLAGAPGLNGYLRFGSYVAHKTVDVSFLVAIDGGDNLAQAKICDIDKKSLADIADELRQRSTRLLGGNDQEFNKTQNPLKQLPGFMVRPAVWATGFLTSSLGLSVPTFGLKAFPFGACIITSVGMFGIDEGYVPPTPFARVPVYLLVGALRDAPTVVDGQVTTRKELTITATIDHRFIDGAQLATLSKIMRGVLENPWQLIGGDQPE